MVQTIVQYQIALKQCEKEDNSHKQESHAAQVLLFWKKVQEFAIMVSLIDKASQNGILHSLDL